MSMTQKFVEIDNYDMRNEVQRIQIKFIRLELITYDQKKTININI